MKEYHYTIDRFRKSLTNALLLLSLCLCVSAVKTAAQEFKTLKPGIEYAEVTKDISGLKVNMNLLRLDLKKVRIDVHHAMDAAIGTEKTSSIATRHGGFAAINAGFFRLDKSIWAGDSAGALVIDGKLLSESFNSRSAMLIDNRKKFTTVFFNHVRAYADIWIGSRSDANCFDSSGINRERKKNEVVLFTPYFGPSTLTEMDGTEIVLSRCKAGKLVGSFRYTECKNASLVKGSGNNKIPYDGFVISIGPDFKDVNNVFKMKLDQLEQARDKGSQIRIKQPIFLDGGQFTIDQNIDLTNGVPQLIKNSKIDITWQEEKSSKSFVETRHPRTAVAKLKDGKFLMITVDGRSESSGGIGLQDLAEYLLSIGATDAMNLDGGGSTTMFVDGKVVNHPSDKEGERKVSDALVVTLRKK